MQGFLNWLTVAAFLMSAATWVFAFIHNRKKIHLKLYSQYLGADFCCFRMAFINGSRIPISITGVSILSADKEFHCRTTPKVITEYSRTKKGNIIYLDTEKDIALPIDLSSLASASGLVYFSFEGNRESLPLSSSNVTFRVYSNRGKPIEKTLSLVQVPHLFRK